MVKLPKAAVCTFIGIAILVIVIFKSSVVIESGQAVVSFITLDNGVDRENTYGEGFHSIAP